MIHSFDYPELPAGAVCGPRLREDPPAAARAAHAVAHLHRRMWNESVESNLASHRTHKLDFEVESGATRSMRCTR